MKGEEILDLVRLEVKDDLWPHYVEINDAYEYICRRAGYWISRVRDEDSLEFRDGKDTYDLPMDRIRRLEQVWVKNNEDQLEWLPLRELDSVAFEREVFAHRNNEGNDIEDVPRHYRLQGGLTGQIQVAPTPDGTYTGRLVYIGNPPPIKRTTEPVLPTIYHRIIAKKAAAIILRNRNTEPSVAQATGLEREVQLAMFQLAADLSANRAGVDMPKRRIMRS